jgi:histidine triad (HIT) family protein
MTPEPSIFSKIINGEIPCHKVYEDDKTLAFLDINPVTEGHTLIIPKTQVEFVWDLPSDDYTALMATVQKVGLHLRDVLGTPYVGELVVGTDVPHAHIHLVPFQHTDELKRVLFREDIPADHSALAALAARLAF